MSSLKVLRLTVFALPILAVSARAEVVKAIYSSATTVPVTAASYTAAGNTVDLALNFAPPPGTNLTVVNITGRAFIQGSFGNLAQGQRVTLAFAGARYPFVANYYGGSGNDLILQWASNRIYTWGRNSNGQLGNGGIDDGPIPGAIDDSGVLADTIVTAVAAGSDFSLALGTDGSLAAWGDNSSGQLGDGTLTASPVPVAVTATGMLDGKSVIAIAAGSGYCLALCSDGALAAWGNNSSGQLGNGSYSNSKVPLPVTASGVLASKTVTAIAAGGGHSLALCADGTLAAWGANSSGQLGNNSTSGSKIPVLVNTSGILAGRMVVAIAAGYSHSLALCADGTLAAWGYNYDGQLGTGTNTRSSVPVAIATTGVLAGKTVVEIAAGNSHCLVLCADGTLAAWGGNGSGQLGNGNNTSSNVPVAVTTTGILAGRTAVAIAAGSAMSRVLCADGRLAAWGAALLGDGGSGASNVPVAVATSGTGSGKIFAALGRGSVASHSAAMLALPPSSNSTLSGLALNRGALTTAVAAGITSYVARVPHGTTSLTITPTAADPGATMDVNGVPVGTGTASAEQPLTPGGHPIPITVTAADGATTTSYAITVKDDATLAGLGLSAGALVPAFSPDSTIYRSYVPAAAATLILTPIATDETAAIQVNGAAVTTASVSLELAPGPNSITVTVTALDGTATVYCLEIIRQVPLHLTFASADTVPVTADHFTATGNTLDFGLDFAPSTGTNLTVIDNTGREWISGQFSNLVQGQAVILTYNKARYRFIVNYHGGTGNDLTLQWAKQKIYAWGDNSRGQYGNELHTQGDIPVAVEPTGALAGKTIIALARGGLHSLALCADGSLVTWGAGDKGQLGDGRFISSSIPVAVVMNGVLVGKAVIAVAAGQHHNLALCNDGTLAAWGYGSNGQLGNGTLTNSGIPVAVTLTGALAGKTIVALAAGPSHSLALCADGTAAAWGNNDWSQLGNGSTASSSVPVAVKAAGALAGKTIVAIAAGAIHHLALCGDGTLAAWGGNDSGQLGNGTVSSVCSVIPGAVDTSGVLGGKAIAAITAGTAHCLVRCVDGTLASWGANPYGRLGTGTSATGNVPLAVDLSGVLAGKTVTSLVAGSAHSLVLATDGTPVAWGDIYGQTGSSNYTALPVAIPTSSLGRGERITALAAGSSANHSLALAAVPIAGDSSLAAVSLNPGGLVSALLPDITTYTACVPHGTTAVAVTPTASDPDAIITVDGMTLDSGTASPAIAVSPGTAIAISVSAPNGGTTSYTITVRDDSTLADLGLSRGSLAPGFSPAVLTYPAYVATATDSLRITPTAADSSAAIEVGGTPVASGAVSDPLPLKMGENPVSVSVTAPDGSTTIYRIAVIRQVPLVFSYPSASAVPVTADAYTASGNSVELSLGFAPTSGTHLTVVNHTGLDFITGEFTNLTHGQVLTLSYQNANYHFWANYHGGTGNDLVLEWVNQKVYAHGSNNYGQLGDGTLTRRSVPTAVVSSGVLAGKMIAAVASGGSHSLALCADGTLASWGWNYYGQLGDGSVMNRNVPVAVSTADLLPAKTVIAIAAGGGHSLALCADGRLIAWGSNSYGQLGTGTRLDSRVPVAVDQSGVLAGRTVAAIAAGEQHSLALCTDGTLATWGVNDDGQLGDGTLISRASPVAVTTSGILSGKAVMRIAAGSWRSFALCADGTLAAWGNNSSGSLGTGNSTHSVVPVDITHSGILAGRTVIAIASGINHSLALCADGTLASWGAGSGGQLGTGTSVSTSLLPAEVETTAALAGKTVVTLSAGYTHSAALCADGTLAAWGNNHGAAGTSVSLAPVAVPMAAMGNGERFASLTVGASAYHLVTLAAAPDSANSRLSALTLNPGAPGPAFTPGTTTYTVKVPAGTSTLTVTPTAMDAGAVIEVNGITAASGLPSGPISCAPLPVTLIIKVTAQDGLASTTYRLGIVNVAPLFAGYEAATPYQTATTLHLRKLLAKASDPDGDALRVATAGPASAAGGTVVLETDSILYTPPNDFSGMDSFPVVITDAAGASASNSVFVTVGQAPGAGGVGANPPTLTSLPGGRMGIAFHGIPGRSYRVQRSVDGLDHWITLATPVADASGRVSFTDDSPPPDNAFYRLALP